MWSFDEPCYERPFEVVIMEAESCRPRGHEVAFGAISQGFRIGFDSRRRAITRVAAVNDGEVVYSADDISVEPKDQQVRSITMIS